MNTYFVSVSYRTYEANILIVNAEDEKQANEMTKDYMLSQDSTLQNYSMLIESKLIDTQTPGVVINEFVGE